MKPDPSQSLPCPVCRTPAPFAGNPHRPFCSARCRTIDLGNWATERYRLPGPPLSAAEEGGDDDGNDGQ